MPLGVNRDFPHGFATTALVDLPDACVHQDHCKAQTQTGVITESQFLPLSLSYQSHNKTRRETKQNKLNAETRTGSAVNPLLVHAL